MKKSDIKILKEKFRKFDFIAILVIGLSIVFWLFITKEVTIKKPIIDKYIGCFLLTYLTISLAYVRRDFVYHPEKYKNKITEEQRIEAIKSMNERSRVNRNMIILTGGLIFIPSIINQHFDLGIPEEAIIFGAPILTIIFYTHKNFFK